MMTTTKTMKVILEMNLKIKAKMQVIRRKEAKRVARKAEKEETSSKNASSNDVSTQ
jgi:hypothetical protein